MEWSCSPTPLHTFMESIRGNLSSTFLLHTVNHTERVITFQKATGIRKYEQKYSAPTIACVRTSKNCYMKQHNFATIHDLVRRKTLIYTSIKLRSTKIDSAYQACCINVEEVNLS